MVRRTSWGKEKKLEVHSKTWEKEKKIKLTIGEHRYNVQRPKKSGGGGAGKQRGTKEEGKQEHSIFQRRRKGSGDLELSEASGAQYIKGKRNKTDEAWRSHVLSQ